MRGCTTRGGSAEGAAEEGERTGREGVTRAVEMGEKREKLEIEWLKLRYLIMERGA
jgi:hypothetical protein